MLSVANRGDVGGLVFRVVKQIDTKRYELICLWKLLSSDGSVDQ